MPGGNLTYDELYTKVASNNPKLTKDQFAQDMRDPQKSYRLFENIQQTKQDGIPADYKTFVNNYGFNKPAEQKPAAPTAPGLPPPAAGTYPTDLNTPEGQEIMKQNMAEDDKKQQAMIGGVMLRTGLYKKDDNGNIVQKDPMVVDVNKQLDSKADDFFKKMSNPNDGNITATDKYDAISPLLNGYYGTTDKVQRNLFQNMIKEVVPDWQPFTDEQWKQLSDAKVGMYLQYLAEHQNNDDNTNSALDKIQNSGNPELDKNNGPLIQNTVAQSKANAKNIDDMYKQYADVMYRGQSTVKDPSYFWANLANGLKTSIPFVKPTETGKDYNQKVVNALAMSGVQLTDEQKKDAIPSLWNTIAGGAGSVTGFILPMIATHYTGEALNVEQVGAQLAKSENAITRFAGNNLKNMFSNTMTMTAANMQNPISGMVQGMSFALTDAALSKMGIVAKNNLGKIFGKFMSGMIVNGGKGIISGYTSNVASGYYTMAKDYILGSDDFKKEMGKENPTGWYVLMPTTKDAIANIATMTMFGVAHGALDFGSAYQDLKKNGFSKLADDMKQQYSDVVAKQKITSDAVENLVKQKPNDKMAVPLDVKGNDIVKTDKSIGLPREEKNIGDIDKNSPSAVKAITQNFADEDELNSFKRKATMKGLAVKTFDLKDEDGDAKGHTAIAYDKNFEPVTNRIHELLVKENNGSLTVDEIPELASLEGQDPKKMLSELANKATNPELKEKYNTKLQEITDKTENGYGAYNEIAALNKQIEEAKGTGKNTSDIEKQAIIEARKYGFAVHYGDKGLEISDGKNIIGTEPKIRMDNAHEIEDLFKSGAAIDELQPLGDRDGIKFMEDEEGGRVVKFGDKVIAKDNVKGINDYDNVRLPKMLNAIGNAKDVYIEDMEAKDIGDAMNDINNGVKSVNAERLMDAANDMLTKGQVITQSGNIPTEAFMATHAKPSPESLIYKKNSSQVSSITKDAIDPHTIEKKLTVKAPMFKDMELEDLKKMDVEKLSDKDKSILQNVIKSKEKSAGADKLKKEQASVEKFAEEEHPGHISVDWDGDTAEVFMGRDQAPIEYSRKELEEKGVFEGEPDASKKKVTSEESSKEGSVKQLQYALPETDLHTAGFFASNKNAFQLKTDQLKNLAENQKPLALSDNALRQDYSELFNKYMSNPEEMKANLNRLSAEYYNAAQQQFNEGDIELHNQNMFTSERLAAISDAIRDKDKGGLRDIRNFGQILANKKLFVVGEHEVHARTLDEANMIDELKKTQTPMTRDEANKTEKALSLNNATYLSMMGTEKAKAEGMFGKGKEWLADSATNLINAVRNAAYLHNTAEPELRPRAQEMMRKIIKARVKDANENISKVVNQLDNSNFKLPEDSKKKVTETFYMGWHQFQKYFTPDELRAGQPSGYFDKLPHQLNDEEISAYNKIVDAEKYHQKLFKDADKEAHKYNDMSVEQKRKFDETHKTYLEQNTGHIPFARHGDYWVIYHGLNDITKTEEPHKELYETEKEAQARAKELSSKTYQVGNETKKYVGVDMDNNRAEKKPIIVDKAERLPAQLIKATSGGDIASIEYEKSKFSPNSREYKALDNVINKLKSEKYNPAFLPSSHVLGSAPTWGNMMESLKQQGQRASRSLSRSKAANIWDKESKMFNPEKYANTRQRYTDWYNDMMTSSSATGGENLMSNAIYYLNLAGKPLFLAQQIAHNISTVYPEMKNELRIISREQKGVEGKSTAMLHGEPLFMQSWGNASALTSHLIGEYGQTVASDVEKALYSVGGKASPAGGGIVKDFDTWFKDTPEGRVMQRLINRGTVGHTFYNDIQGKDAGTAGKRAVQLSGAATAYADIFTRAHAAFTGLELGKMKGLTDEKELMNYAEDFVDRTKFVYNKANRMPIMRDIKIGEGEQKGTGKVAFEAIRRGMLMMKQSHIMDNFYNIDLIRRAENKTASLAELMVPRLILGGAKSVVPMAGVIAGLSYWGYRESQGKEQLKNVLNLPEQSGELDAAIRRYMDEHVGGEEGRKWSDMSIYGAGSLMNADLRSTIDLGSILRENMPVSDQLLGVGASSFLRLQGLFGDSKMTLPGELGNLQKAFQWYQIMENRAHNLPGQKTIFTGQDVAPSISDIGTKLAGINTVATEKYYDAIGMKERYVGSNGRGTEPQGGSLKYNLIQNIRSATIKNYAAKRNEINAYLEHPSDDNFKAAFGQGMYDEITNYNIGLIKDVYTSFSALGTKGKEGMDLLDQYRQYGIGLTWEDNQWEKPETDLSNDTGVQKEIRYAIKSMELDTK